MKFYYCKTCKNIVHFIKDSGVPLICCGKIMDEIVPNSIGAAEKHLPIVRQNGNHVTVDVGSLPHPMIDVHYIEWVILETQKGFQFEPLNPGDAPRAEFFLNPLDKAVTAYAYCNIHGLWKSN